MSAAPRLNGRSGPEATRPVVADKMFFKIGEVGRLTGLESYVLRYWETEFPALRPRKTSGGQRVYTKKDVDLVFRIKQMLYEQGFTIAGARKRLRGRGGDDRVEPRELLGEIRGELQSILNDLKACTAPRGAVASQGTPEPRGQS